MTKTIVLGGGCFWCLEAIYQRVRGVEGVRSGYAGGSTENPDYANHADHAEVVEISYDESVIDLEKVLEIFFNIHDPTTLNRQGHDVGTSYRSIILYEAEEERELAEQSIADSAKLWDNPIVTEVKKLQKFNVAEDMHQNYYNDNASAGYCQIVINPKLEKFQTKFADYVK